MSEPAKGEPIWIDDALVSMIHGRQLAEHGGHEGIRDASLLQGDPARPLNHFLYTGADVVDLAAKYIAGIVQNHPFIDGNKRTGFVVGITFLELNSYRFTATEADAAQAVLELAAGTINEDGLREFIRARAQRE
jgi:death-on-curing protein